MKYADKLPAFFLGVVVAVATMFMSAILQNTYPFGLARSKDIEDLRARIEALEIVYRQSEKKEQAEEAKYRLLEERRAEELARKVGDLAAVQAAKEAIKRAEEDAARKARSAMTPETEALYQQALVMERSGKGADAVRFYRRAARAGHGKAALRLGDLFTCGAPGISRDHQESLQWYETARDLGQTITAPGNCQRPQ